MSWGDAISPAGSLSLADPGTHDARRRDRQPLPGAAGAPVPGRGPHPGAGQPDLPGGPEVLLRVSACRRPSQPGLPHRLSSLGGEELSGEVTVKLVSLS